MKELTKRSIFTIVSLGIVAVCVWLMCCLATDSLPNWLITILGW